MQLSFDVISTFQNFIASTQYTKIYSNSNNIIRFTWISMHETEHEIFLRYFNTEFCIF